MSIDDHGIICLLNITVGKQSIVQVNLVLIWIRGMFYIRKI